MDEFIDLRGKSIFISRIELTSCRGLADIFKPGLGRQNNQETRYNNQE